MIKYQSAKYGFYYKLINWLTRLSDDIEYGRSPSKAFSITVTTDYTDIIQLSKLYNINLNYYQYIQRHKLYFHSYIV